jgi:hypothetical protein
MDGKRAVMFSSVVVLAITGILVANSNDQSHETIPKKEVLGKARIIVHEKKEKILLDPDISYFEESCTEILEKMEEGSASSEIEEIAGRITVVRPGGSNASRPYENYRLGPVYIFPKISDLQQRYLGKEISLDENWRIIHAAKPSVGGQEKYKTSQHYEYAAEYEKRIKSFKDFAGKHVVAAGRIRRHDEYTYFEINHVESVPSIYEWDIPEKEEIEFNRVLILSRKDANFILEMNNPFEQPIESLIICLSPDYPKLFEFNGPNVKKISLLKPGESKRVNWNFKIKEPWRQKMKLLVYAPGEPVIASYESIEIVGTQVQKDRNLEKQIDPKKHERQAQKAVLDNPPPNEFSEFYYKEVRDMLRNADYNPSTFSPYVWPALVFAYKNISVERGPVEVLFSHDGIPTEVLYHVYKPGYSLKGTKIVKEQEEDEITKNLSFITREMAIEKSRKLKGGSENFIYNYATANLWEIPEEPHYVWIVTYHSKKEVSASYNNALYDYIHPEGADLLLGTVVVKTKIE